MASGAGRGSSSSTYGWLTPARLWVFIFALWGLFLSGALAQVVGSPGVLQLVRLQSLWQGKQTQAEQIRRDIQRLENDSLLLEKSKVVQQREIRRILGYASEDELIFDFTNDAK